MNSHKIPILHKSDKGVNASRYNVFSYHTHMHSYYEMTLYEPFDGTVTINDNIFKINTITAVLIAPSDFHRIEVSGTAQSPFIKIAFDADPSLVGEAIESSIILQEIKKEDFIYHIFQEIFRTSGNSIYKTFLVHAALLAISEKGMRVQPSRKTRGNELSKKALRIINERFSDNITLPSLAEELSVSPQYLSTVFKKNVGISFIEHLNNVRLRRASKLLLETQENITRISEMCGYRDLSHFLRCFKASFGSSPLVYRKNNK